MDEMGRTTGLNRRKGSTRLQFRRRWPTDVAHLLPGEGMARSTGSTDYAEARRRFREIEEEYDRIVEEARLRATMPAHGIFSRSAPRPVTREPFQQVLTDADAYRLASDFFARSRADLDRQAQPIDPDEIWHRRIDLDAQGAALHDPENPQGQSWASEVADNLLERARLHSVSRSASEVLLVELVRRAMLQLVALERRRLSGDFSDHIADAMFARVSSVPVPLVETSAASITTTLLEPTLVDEWAKERAVSPKGIDKHRAVLRWFIERGGPPHVEAITRQHILAFKKSMIDGGVTAANANAKLSCLRTLLGYAVENSYIDANPAAGVGVQDKDRDRRKRKEFTLAALQAIFSSPVYSKGERPTQGRGEAAYWLPLIALFTGARLEEIAQLRPKDIRLETYADQDGQQCSAWVIEIVETDETSTKNAASERIVPVHTELERLGLVQHAKAAADAGHERLFPELRPNKYGRLGAKWGEWWSRYRREVCGVTDPRMVFHSFRYTFKQHARHVGMIDGVQRQIMGHSPGDTADEYGASRYSLHQLVEGMRLYRIAGLNLLPSPTEIGPRVATSCR